MKFRKCEKTMIAANTGFPTDPDMSKAAFKRARFGIISHTWTVSHLVSYLSILHQVFSPLEAFVELRDPPWCNDLGKEKTETTQRHNPINTSKKVLQNYLNVRVEGVAWELKTYLVISLRSRYLADVWFMPLIPVFILGFYAFVCQLSAVKRKMMMQVMSLHLEAQSEHCTPTQPGFFIWPEIIKKRASGT